MITQPRWGVFGQRYGSFAGKGGSGAHPVDKITQPRWGVFGQRYGDFSGKTSDGTHPVDLITQTRWGVFGQRYSSFAGKSIAPPPPPVAVQPTGDVLYAEEQRWLKRTEEEEIISLIIALHESRR